MRFLKKIFINNIIKMCDCPPLFIGSAVAEATAPTSFNSIVKSSASATA